MGNECVWLVLPKQTIFEIHSLFFYFKSIFGYWILSHSSSVYNGVGTIFHRHDIPTWTSHMAYYEYFSHTRQWMIEQAHEIQLWMLRVYCISRQLYYIGHVTSIVINCFQGRPYHLAPLTSLWRHDISPYTHSVTDRRSLFRNVFVHYLMNLSFMASLASVCGLFF